MQVIYTGALNREKRILNKTMFVVTALNIYLFN